MPIFGKLRINEIGLNGFRRYLLYALGEILLVMIGILLALEVSNWNDEKKERVLEKELLTGILTGLQSDLEDLTSNYNQHYEIVKSQKIVLSWLEGKDPFTDSLKLHMAQAHAYTEFISQDGQYETLKTSGTQIIKNPGLGVKISNF